MLASINSSTLLASIWFIIIRQWIYGILGSVILVYNILNFYVAHLISFILVPIFIVMYALAQNNHVYLLIKVQFCINLPFNLFTVTYGVPFILPSSCGTRYFLNIVDDFSRCTWLYLMHSKNETLKYIKFFHSFIRTQYSHTIHTISTSSPSLYLPILQKIRTNNGSEFLSNEFQTWLISNGIHHQRSCTYTPQQNGVVERKHRHLLNVA